MPSIIRPIITEKSLGEAKTGRFTFETAKEATKTEIKMAAEKMWGVTVVKVQTATVPGKSYRTGRKWMRAQRPDWKKAMVTLKQGQKIDLFDTKAE